MRSHAEPERSPPGSRRPPAHHRGAERFAPTWLALRALQRSAGNRAVAALVQPRVAVQRAPADTDAIAAALEAHFWSSVRTGDWRQAALDLNGFNDTDIMAKLIILTHDQLIGLDAGARHAMPTWSQRVITPLISVDAEADRVGHLTFNYETALAAHNWAEAIVSLNGFNDADIVVKLSRLRDTSGSDLGHLRNTARSTLVGGGRMARLVDAVSGQTVETRADEQVGGQVYTVRGGYTWRLRPDAIVVDVGMSFHPDPGVVAPTAAWFGYIRSTWNHFSAVNQTNPAEKKRIEFDPIAGPGHDIQVSAGDGRANAGHYYAGDSRASTTVPHEFGHLIGLEDEYERDSGDYRRVTGETPAAGSGQTALAQTIARGIHDALFLGERFFERHRTAERRRMAAVNKVLADNHIAANYQAGRSALTAEVAHQYGALHGAEMSAHFMSRVDTDEDEFNTWREQVLGTFQFTSTSIMGDMSDHTHPVQARHVRAFAGYVQQALARGTWAAQEDH